MKHPRAIDQALVDAYLARRALDYLVGFTLSPVLWRKLPGVALGRPRAVGGAAARLRPRARDREIRRPRILVAGGDARDAARRRPSRRGSSAPTARRSSGSTSVPAPRPRPSSRRWKRQPSRSPTSRRSRPSATPTRPSPPRPCSRRRAASSASRRPTPCGSPSASTRASTSAARPSASSPICAPTASRWRTRRSSTIRKLIGAEYGKPLRAGGAAPLPDQGEERPGSPRGDPPDRPVAAPARHARKLDADQAKLYELIWKRAVASQMESAELERTTVDIAAKVGARLLDLRATGTRGQVRRLPASSTRKAATTSPRTRSRAACPP